MPPAREPIRSQPICVYRVVPARVASRVSPNPSCDRRPSTHRPTSPAGYPLARLSGRRFSRRRPAGPLTQRRSATRRRALGLSSGAGAAAREAGPPCPPHTLARPIHQPAVKRLMRLRHGKRDSHLVSGVPQRTRSGTASELTDGQPCPPLTLARWRHQR